MNAEKMMDLIGEARSDYVQSALESRTQSRKKPHISLSRLTRVAIAAAMVFSLAITAYAADFAGIKSLRSGISSKVYDSYQKLDAVEKKAGFEIDAKEVFDNGYTFDRMLIDSTDALDEHDRKVLSYDEIYITYKNKAGNRLCLTAHPTLDEIPFSDIPATQTRQIGDVTAEFRESHYKNFPAEKEGNLTEEEKLWEQQPGNYISYFSWEADAYENTVYHVCWTKDGISYSIMDNCGVESPDTLFSMAQELIAQ